ncbi:hypothetical protein SEA_CREWMATE_73 [Arthrobacter phage Crewmate]|uniref:Uncharacterized protein n=1 Tax=Arthrobacter phage Crewmate TaxID=2832317 RepID=A0AA49B382_9CAUD|nr:hypothetical protein PQE17_gp73 [Arthrobacter phage Crewmate]UIW13324.1 hypothetical protein SEA_CREWMATE_73 [Arthrobacter phage Crewmate]WGH21249.1 hypothetical protein SEA_OBITOO_73 [Arthrobacter phage ObiToo]
MMLMLQIRDIAVALKIGLHFGKVDHTPTPPAQDEAPASASDTPSPSPRRYPVGFSRNEAA